MLGVDLGPPFGEMSFRLVPSPKLTVLAPITEANEFSTIVRTKVTSRDQWGSRPSCGASLRQRFSGD